MALLCPIRSVYEKNDSLAAEHTIELNIRSSRLESRDVVGFEYNDVESMIILTIVIIITIEDHNIPL